MSKTATTKSATPAKSSGKQSRGILFFKLAVTFIIGVFILSNWLKEPLWGIHHYSYIGDLFAYLCISVVGIIWLIPDKFWPLLPTALLKLPKGKIWGPILAIVLSGIFFSVFKNNPIKSDIYGDARNFHKLLQRDTINGIESKWVNEVITPNIFKKNNGEAFVFNSIRIVRAVFKCDTTKAFALWNALWGAVFIFSFTLFVFLLYDSWIKILLSMIMGFTTGFLLCYFGYTEIYAVSMTFIFIYLMFLFMYVKTQKWVWLLPTLLFLFLSVKAHITSACLSPALVLSLIYVYRDKIKLPLKLDKNKSILFFFVIPGVLFFLMVYFGLKNHNSSHIFIESESKMINHIFLPLVKEAPPLNRYTIFSTGHIIDCLNILFYWSIPCLIFVAWYYGKRTIQGTQALIVKIFFINFVLYTSVFFLINPILGMPRDWDLMSLPAPSLLMLVLVILYYLPIPKFEKIHTKVFVLITVFASIGTCVYTVNGTHEMLGKHIVHSGSWMYKTYWAGSSYMINVGFRVADMDTTEQIKMREVLVKDLESYAVKGKDGMYGDICIKLGDLYMMKKDNNKSISTYLKSLKYVASPQTYHNLCYLYYMSGNFQEALKYSRACVQAYANDPNRLLLYIDIELKNNQRAQAKQICGMYLKLVPNDGRIIQLMNSL